MYKAFIIPGYFYKSTDKPYKEIKKYFEEKKIKTIILDIAWQRRIMDDWADESFLKIKDQINKKDKIILLGFSFGAMISLILSTKFDIDSLILCSLSPYFKEDLPRLKKSWLSGLGDKRIASFKNLSFNKILKQIKSDPKIFLLYGEKEPTLLIKRVDGAKKKIKNSETIRILNAKHNLADLNYLNAVKNIINK